MLSVAKRTLTWTAVAILATAVLISCGGRARAEGKWLRLDVKTGSFPGDFLVIEPNGTFHMTGNPAMDGKAVMQEGKLHLKIEKVGDMTRAEAIQTPGAANVEERLKQLDAQLVFELTRDDDGTEILKQVGPSAGFAEWRFERAPGDKR